MDEASVVFGARERHVEGALSVDLVGGFLLALSRIDCVVCGAVEDHAGLVMRQRPIESREICHRHLLAREPDSVRQQLHQLRSQKTRRSEHEGFHQPELEQFALEVLIGAIRLRDFVGDAEQVLQCGRGIVAQVCDLVVDQGLRNQRAQCNPRDRCRG